MAVAAPVATAVAGWLGTGTVATVTAAVVGAAAQGAVYGAVIGAATSAVSGNNIFEGALKGAAMGGVAGGLVSLGGMALQAAGQGTWATAAARQPGITAGGGTKVPQTRGLLQTPGGAPGPYNPATGQPIPATTPPAPTPKPPMSPERAQIYAGIGSGAAQGVAQVGGAMIAEKAGEERLEQEEEARRRRIEGNVPGDFEQRMVNIQLPELWTRYKQPLGLLEKGRAAA